MFSAASGLESKFGRGAKRRFVVTDFELGADSNGKRVLANRGVVCWCCIWKREGLSQEGGQGVHGKYVKGAITSINAGPPNKNQ